MKLPEVGRLVGAADFRSGNSVCVCCGSLGSLAPHLGVVDPDFVLVTCRACSGCFFMGRPEFEQLAALRSSVVAVTERRVTLQ